MALTKLFAVGTSDSASGTVLTSGTFNSTGYTHLVVFAKHEGAAVTMTLSDNKGSSGPTNLTKESNTNGDVHGQITWMPIASPGSGHTATITYGSASPYRGMVVWLVNTTGTLSLDVESTAEGTGTSTCDAGSLVTTAATVSFMGVGEYTTVTYTVGTGWTEDYDSGHYGQSRSDASGTLDPVCEASGVMGWVACAASFKETGGGGRTTKNTRGFGYGMEVGMDWRGTL